LNEGKPIISRDRLANASREIGSVRHDRRRILLHVECDAELEARAPLDLRTIGLVLVRNIELDDSRECNRVRNHELCAQAGEIADQAIEASAPIVEIDAPLQKAPQARAIGVCSWRFST
jgi:hypothetical protein